jgi:hypothetical protein
MSAPNISFRTARSPNAISSTSLGFVTTASSQPNDVKRISKFEIPIGNFELFVVAIA